MRAAAEDGLVSIRRKRSSTRRVDDLDLGRVGVHQDDQLVLGVGRVDDHEVGAADRAAGRFARGSCAAPRRRTRGGAGTTGRGRSRPGAPRRTGGRTKSGSGRGRPGRSRGRPAAATCSRNQRIDSQRSEIAERPLGHVPGVPGRAAPARWPRGCVVVDDELVVVVERDQRAEQLARVAADPARWLMPGRVVNPDAHVRAPAASTARGWLPARLPDQVDDQPDDDQAPVARSAGRAARPRPRPRRSGRTAPARRRSPARPRPGRPASARRW